MADARMPDEFLDELSPFLPAENAVAGHRFRIGLL